MGCTHSNYTLDHDAVAAYEDDLAHLDHGDDNVTKSHESRETLRVRRPAQSSARTTLTSVAEDTQLVEEADRDRAKSEHNREILKKQIVAQGVLTMHRF